MLIPNSIPPADPTTGSGRSYDLLLHFVTIIDLTSQGGLEFALSDDGVHVACGSQSPTSAPRVSFHHINIIYASVHQIIIIITTQMLSRSPQSTKFNVYLSRSDLEILRPQMTVPNRILGPIGRFAGRSGVRRREICILPLPISNFVTSHASHHCFLVGAHRAQCHVCSLIEQFR